MIHLSPEERAVVERMRAEARKKRGTVECYDCGGTGSYSQSDCDVCGGSGELKADGPEIRKRVLKLEVERKIFNKKIDAAIQRVRGGL